MEGRRKEGIRGDREKGDSESFLMMKGWSFVMETTIGNRVGGLNGGIRPEPLLQNLL